MPSNQDDIDQYDIANFDKAANDPKLWTMRAEDLYLAAHVLRDKVTSMPFEPEKDLTAASQVLRYSGIVFPSVMLQGFAIEAFLKAYWITEGNTVSQNGEYKIPTIKRDAHDLPLIAAGVGFKLSAREREVLARLSLFVSSYGRYPITKKCRQNPMKKNKQGILHRFSWDNKDHKTAEAVIKRLRKKTAT